MVEFEIVLRNKVHGYTMRYQGVPSLETTTICRGGKATTYIALNRKDGQLHLFDWNQYEIESLTVTNNEEEN